jgi:hypothetical protein
MPEYGFGHLVVQTRAESLQQCFFPAIFPKLRARSAQGERQLVQVRDLGYRPHQAMGVAAMDQSKRVKKLMDRHFGGTGQKELLADGGPIGSRLESEKRYHRSPAGYLCLPVNMSEYGQEEIEGCDAHDSKVFAPWLGGERRSFVGARGFGRPVRALAHSLARNRRSP